MDKFLDAYDLSLIGPRGYKSPKQIYNKQWDWGSNSFPTMKSPGPDGFTAEF
jgi:hypothetical protein